MKHELNVAVISEHDEAYVAAKDPVPDGHRLMLAAFRLCGRMSAARWLDHTIERNAGDDEFIDRVTQRGDVVRVVDVPRGAAPPEPICESGCARCRDLEIKGSGLSRG